MLHTGTVTATDLPGESLLQGRAGPADFLDCYRVASDLPPRRAAEIITNFPGWARFLMKVREVMTSPFGLLNEGPAAQDKVGIFPVEAENDRELIAGFNDRHLDFRISVMSMGGQVLLATWVHPHNVAGRLYLTTILPFHILISRDALARVHLAAAPGD